MTSEQFWDKQLKYDELRKMSNEDYDKVIDDFVNKCLEKNGDIIQKVKPKSEYEPSKPYEEMSIEEVNEEFQKINDRFAEGEKKLILNTPQTMKLNKSIEDSEFWDEFIEDDVDIDDVMTVKKTDITVADIDNMLNEYDKKYGYLYEKV